MTVDVVEVIEAVAKEFGIHEDNGFYEEDRVDFAAKCIAALEKAGMVIVPVPRELKYNEYTAAPVMPTRAMLIAAREWSREKYGKPIGDEAASECYRAMINAHRGGGDGE